MAGSPSVNLWVKPETFLIGALPIPPHSRLSTNNIKKIVTYAKSKGKGGFPRITYGTWRHIACNKLTLPQELAWSYFSTCELLTETDPRQRGILDQNLARATTRDETEHAKNLMSVHTLKFVLYLFLQHSQKISLRASLVSGSDEWPTRARSPDLAGRSTPTGSGSKLNETSNTKFVTDALNDIMELLVEPDSYSGGMGGSDLCLSVEAVEALGFVIAGSVDNNRTVKPLHDIALMQQIHQKSGFSKVNVEATRSPKGKKLVISRSFSFRNLQTWLQTHITQNPFGVASCIQQGRRLSWPLAGEDKELRADSKRGKIATNALFVPKDQAVGNKLIIMSQVCKQTVARSSGTLEGSSLKIHRCHYSYIYLLSPIRSVSIEKCRKSTIVLGAVETGVQISGCEQVTVIAAGRRFSISGCGSSTFHLLTPSHPLLFGGNDNITLAPYHTHYPKLHEHLEAASLSPKPNLWDQPLCLGSDHNTDSPCWRAMPPAEFYTFGIPFQMEGPTKDYPSPLPPVYQKALQERKKQIENWHKTFKDAGLTRPQKKQFQGLVEDRFQEYIAATGQNRELESLVVPMSAKK